MGVDSLWAVLLCPMRAVGELDQSHVLLGEGAPLEHGRKERSVSISVYLQNRDDWRTVRMHGPAGDASISACPSSCHTTSVIWNNLTCQETS